MVQLRSNKLLFCTGEGIGNFLQCIPVIRTLTEVLGYEVDVWHAFGQFKVEPVIPYVSKFFVGGTIKQANLSEYKGAVATFWARNHVSALRGLSALTKIYPLSMYRSEVDTYMQIARDLGAEEEDLLWHGVCDYSIKKDTKFDVVVANGYNRFGAANWSIKGYPYYQVLCDLLKEQGLTVASLGAPDEYVKGTVNRTGLALKHSFGAIKQAKLLISNDTGMYHAANALETPNVVIFTATSIAKNYDKKFHKYSGIVGRDDLECRKDCQAHRRWNRNCKDWACQQISPKYVFREAMSVLKGENE